MKYTGNNIRINHTIYICILLLRLYITHIQWKILYQMISNKYHRSIVSTSEIMALQKTKGASALFLAAIIVVQAMVFLSHPVQGHGPYFSLAHMSTPFLVTLVSTNLS
jgi:hypothetical protein